MGDLNDYISAELDYWSNKKHSNKQLGSILHPLRRIKFFDSFRITHPEQKVFSRIGEYEDQGLLNTKKITMTRIDYILMSFELIQKLDCVAILDAYNIGSDHRPIFAVLNITVDIPHIASISKQTTNIITNSTSNDKMPPQPSKKYLQNLDNEQIWLDFANTAQNNFLKSDRLITAPQNTNDIDEWADTFLELIDSAAEQTFGWVEPASMQKHSENQENEHNNLSNNSKSHPIAEYTIPDTDVQTPIPKILYKNKLKLDLFKNLNILKSCLSSITGLLTSCTQNKLVPLTNSQKVLLEMLWVRLNKKLIDTKQLFFKYDTATYGEIPLEKQQDKSESAYRHR